MFLNLANSYYFEKNYSRALTLLDSAKAGLPQGQVYNQVEAFEQQISCNRHYLIRQSPWRGHNITLQLFVSSKTGYFQSVMRFVLRESSFGTQ